MARNLAFFAAALLGAGILTAGAPDAQSVAPAPGFARWEPPFQHDLTGFPVWLARFNTVHLSLIPKGPHRGKVIAFDVFSDPTEPQWKQRWSIVDVESGGAPEFLNGLLSLPAWQGDFFCSGHAWTADGTLFVAGGTSKYPNTSRHPSGPGKFVGGRLVYIWDPTAGPMGTWVRQTDLVSNRWYPTVLRLSDGRLIVAGGTKATQLDAFNDNDYEVFQPSSPTSGTWELNGASRLFPGPGGFGPFSIYPRLFQLSTGDQFMSGMAGQATRLNHALSPGQWSTTANSTFDYRNYGMSLLLPYRPDALGNYRDEAMILGGIGIQLFRVRSPHTGDYFRRGYGAQTLVETCSPGSTDPDDWNWVHGPRLNQPRTTANTVILADGSLFVIGGRIRGEGEHEVPVMTSELFDGERWTEIEGQASARTYHSAALLLPSGKVLSSGGDTATWDYQIFVPAYLRTGEPRPQIGSAPSDMGYASQGALPYVLGHAAMPPGHSVARAVLVSVGSVTHHTDVNQRYIELVTESSTSTDITVRAPRDPHLVPPGYYMLFLLSSKGVPSTAAWVKVS
jgi:hypothetical protein